MIIYEKILKKYSLKELRVIIGPAATARISKGSLAISLDILCAINFSEINYTFEDFSEDYDRIYGNYKEKEMIYNIFKNGYSLNSLRKMYNLESGVYNYFKKDFFYESRSRNLHKLMHLLEIDVPLENLKIKIYDTHIELFGTKERLNEFKELFKISKPILHEPYEEQWHLAFDGCLAEYIKTL